MSKIKGYQTEIECALAQWDLPKNPENLYEPIRYILSLGGKRLRPAMTLAACEMYGGQIQDAIKPALGIEVFHNFSLLHDDVMDEAEMRRGKPSVHKKWNVNSAILSGDAMLVKSYQLISYVPEKLLPIVLETFSQTALEVCEGQQMDLDFENREDVSEEEYLEMVRLKTAVLLGCSLKIGALIGGADLAQADKLYEFGENIGIAFQIQDDILDSFGDEEMTGKKVGGDILNDKKTLLYIKAFQNAPLPNLRDWDEAEKIRQFQSAFKDSQSLEHAAKRRDGFYAQALENLDETQGNVVLRNELVAFAKNLVERVV